jgi:Family of unknown function (DUF5677)
MPKRGDGRGPFTIDQVETWLNRGTSYSTDAISVTAQDAKVTSISTKLSLIRDHYGDGVLGNEIFPKVKSIEHTGNPIAKVSDFFLRKGTKTLDAICVLCETDFGDDALVLGRTLFELVVYLKWIALPDSIEQRALEQSRSSMMVTGSESRG